ncbi:MAG: non-hydrolyzing UDP-N-acetylglucosamine 2-epimerase [Thermodesulfobacteriota bacterium]
MKFKIINVAGARPNFMKIAPIVAEMDKYPEGIEHLLVHTGQHYDKVMSRSFFEDLEIPRPDIDLGVGSGTHAEQTALVMTRFEKVLLGERPDLVLVVGDVNSTLACSVTAAKLCIPVAHVEAGLRSFDRAMPEEINRIVTDSISDYLFTTCEDADENLKKEGVSEEKIFFVGNVMIDTLLKHREKAKSSRILEELDLNGRPYILLTLHRPSNVDDRKTFLRIVEALKILSRDCPVIFPAHPRTRKQIELFNLREEFQDINSQVPYDGICLMEPVGYLDFLYLMDKASLILTDSGGIQEESTILSVPCLTIRENTERPITIKKGTNILVGTDPGKIIDEGLTALLNGSDVSGMIPELWDGKASERVVSILQEVLLV